LYSQRFVLFSWLPAAGILRLMRRPMARPNAAGICGSSAPIP
jgi:hypothetical protein